MTATNPLNDCFSLTVADLRQILVQNRVPGRSRLTTKQAICSELLRIGLFHRFEQPIQQLPVQQPSIQPPIQSQPVQQQNLFDDIQSQLNNLNIQEPTEAIEAEFGNLNISNLQQQTNNPELEFENLQSQLTQLNVSDAQNVIENATQNLVSEVQMEIPAEIASIQIENLPLNLRLRILSQLDRLTLIRICELGRNWSSICRDESLWQQLVLADFGQYKWGRTLPKIISNASWYANYKVYLWRQRLFMRRLSEKNILRLLNFYQDELTITPAALQLLQEVLTPWVLQFSRIPNIPDLIIPYLTRRLWRLAPGVINEYQQAQDPLAVVDLVITYLIFVAGNFALRQDLFEIDYPIMYNTIYRIPSFNVPFGFELPIFDVNAQ